MTGDQDVNVSVLVRNKGKHPVVEDTMETVLYHYTLYHMMQYVLTANTDSEDCCTRSC